jgi:hypothetical protein
METTPLDSSLPGVRLLQSWIRERCPLSIEVLGAERLEGRLVWQDPPADLRDPSTRLKLQAVARSQPCRRPVAREQPLRALRTGAALAVELA